MQNEHDAEVLTRLTAREREILGRLLDHKKLKTIAFELGVTQSAVDQRLRSARLKLGAADSKDAAQKFQALLQINASEPLTLCENAPEEPFVASPRTGFLGIPKDIPLAAFLDQQFTKLWRLAAVITFSVLFALATLIIVAVIEAVGRS